jgi:hypothetical protein
MDCRTYTQYERHGVKYDMPVFGKDGDPERIWGLTAIILASVLDKVLVPTLLVDHSSGSSSKL